MIQYIYAADSVKFTNLILNSFINDGLISKSYTTENSYLKSNHIYAKGKPTFNNSQLVTSGYSNCKEGCESFTEKLCAFYRLPIDLLECMTWCEGFLVGEIGPYLACVAGCTIGLEILCHYAHKYVCHLICETVYYPVDPNEIVGPPSYGDKKWISKNTFP